MHSYTWIQAHINEITRNTWTAMMGFYPLAIASRPLLGSTQPPVQLVLEGSFTGSKAAGSWRPLTSI